MSNRIVKLIGALILSVTTPPILAASETLSNATVYNLLVQEGAYGGCMANVSVHAQTVNCPPGWVTFSCDGTYNTPQAGKMKYAQALMAFTLKKKVDIHLDDTKKHNTYCYAYRVDLKN